MGRRTTWILRGGLVAILVLTAAVWALSAIGVWCPWAVLRFGGTYTSQVDSQLRRVECIEVTGPWRSRSAGPGWAVRYRLTSPARLAALREFLAARRYGWQENILSSDSTVASFRACDAAEWSPRFLVGTSSLGVTPSKNWSRPLCRRDRERLLELLQPDLGASR